MTKQELVMLQSLPLEVKVPKSKLRIKDAVEKFGVNGLYISISGGKDSTVLYYMVKEDYPEIPAVFCDTGLEYPEVRELALRLADVVIYPDMSFVEVLITFGYPCIGKEVARIVYYARKGKEWALKKLQGLNKDGTVSEFKKRFKKYAWLIEEDFMMSNWCCIQMKEKPFMKYERATGRIGILGLMAEDSQQRESAYLQYGGCNAFNTSRPNSKPLGFWTEQDILWYIKGRKIEIPSVYGDIVYENELDNQIGFYEDRKSKVYTTGCDRTGCVFCMFGCHLEKEGNERFIRLKETHPKLYDYCMRGGKYNEEGIWVPHKGLGMSHVLNKLKVKH